MRLPRTADRNREKIKNIKRLRYKPKNNNYSERGAGCVGIGRRSVKQSVGNVSFIIYIKKEGED